MLDKILGIMPRNRYEQMTFIYFYKSSFERTWVDDIYRKVFSQTLTKVVLRGTMITC